MKDEKKLPTGVTQEMYDNAKAKWPKIGAVRFFDLPTDDDGNVLTVLVRRPCRSVMSEFTKFHDKAPNKADEILVKACLLSHKEEVMADDDLFTVAVDAIAQLIVSRKAVPSKNY